MWHVFIYLYDIILYDTIRFDRVELSNCDDTVGKILLCMIQFDKEVKLLNCNDIILY